MTASRKLALNSLIQIGGKIIMTLIGFVSVRVLTFYLGVEGFGEYTIILSYLTIMTVLAELGLNVIMTTEISQTDSPEVAQHAVSNIFTMRLTAALTIVGGLGATLVWLLGYSMELNLLIIFGSIGAIALSLSHVLIGIFQKNLRSDKITLADMSARVILLLGIVFTAWIWEVSLFWVMVSYVLAGITQAIFMITSARQYYPVGLAFDFNYWRQILWKALPLFIVVAFNLVYYRIDTVMLSVMATSADVGLYGAAYKILEIMITFPGMLIGLLLPILARYYVSDKEAFVDTIQKGFNLLMALAFPSVVAGLFLADDIILLIAGEAFLPAGLALQILYLGVGCIFISNFLGHILIATHLQHKSVFVAITGAVVNVALNLVLIPRFSYLGAAIATALTEVLVLLVYLILVRVQVKVRPQLGLSFVWIMVAGSAMAATFWMFQEVNFIIQAVLGGMVYAGVLVFQGSTRLRETYYINVR